ncbi:MAG: DUF4932 domain-containing protein [Muribaculaceae bacterium]|nr:DUF4932 domain-containing protein [Muribaculaceae bacterium]
MKKLLFIFIGLCSFVPVFALTANYDERVELLSVLCNLADYEEYNMGLAAQYDDAVALCFAPYRDHAAVDMFRRLHETDGIGYNAPIDYALNLKKEGDRFIVDNRNIGDDRWDNVDLDAVADTISMFYRDTNFPLFFKTQESFYIATCNAFTDKVLSLIDESWYPRFYGTEPSETFNVVIGFLTGGCNYGPTVERPGQPRRVYAILGYVEQPDAGVMFVENPEYYRNLLVHEFNHSFVNPMLTNATFYEAMSAPATKLFDTVSTIMNFQAYTTWDTVINESIVRAAVATYFLDNGTPDDARNSINEEMKVGFAWMPGLVGKMDYYRRHRDLYPTFADYYPRLIDFFATYTDSIDAQVDALFTP